MNNGGTRTTERKLSIAAVAEGIIVAAALLVIVGSLGVLGILVFDPHLSEKWTSGLRPEQFYRELDAELLDTYAEVYGVAHNAGDRLDATLVAIDYGADVIEVDVIAVDGQLYAAHDVPASWLDVQLFRGPPLDHIWIVSSYADAIKLDLKAGSPEFLDLLFQFLNDRRGQQRVIVVTGDPAILRRFAEQEPAVLRFLSVGNARDFERLKENPDLLGVLDGVSIRESLIDQERAAWLEEQGILTSAWIVNNLTRVNELVQLGVDAITTDNLAILTLLGGEPRAEHPLDRLRAPSTANPATPSPNAAGDR